MRRPLKRFVAATRFACVTAVALAAAPAAAQRVVDFVQLDASSDSVSFVAARAAGDARAPAPPPLVSATYSRWDGGEAASVGAVWRIALPGAEHAASLGAGVGADHRRSRTDKATDSAASLRLQAESYGPAPLGHYYLLAQASSFRQRWFATAQYDPAPSPLAFELSRQGEHGYHASTLALRIALGRRGWSLRAGSIRDGAGRRAFVGIGYNGF